MSNCGARAGGGLSGVAALSALAIFLTGCATNIGTFPVISTTDPQYASMEKAPVVKGVEGQDSRLWFLCFPMGGPPTLGDAVDSCLSKGHGDFIRQARVYEKRWTILLFSYGAYTVVGDVGDSGRGLPGRKK